MKKVIIAILMFLIGPCSVLAIQVKVDNFLVNANVLENGDMEVEELIIAKGSFNWYERDLLYKNSALTDSTFSNNDLYNAKNILVEKVSAKKVKDDGSWDMFLDEFSDFNLDTYGSNGESGK